MEGNVDELTMRQQEAIDEEISSTTPLVSSLEPLDSLKSEYLSDPVYLHKLTSLQPRYPSLRRTRPDGNCFYRAFSFALLESLISTPARTPQFKTSLVASKTLLGSAGFNQFTVDDFYDTFIEILNRVQGGMSLQELEAAFREPSLADYLVVYLRIVTSAELKRDSGFYGNFIEGKSVEEFCQLEVEPMYKECDQIMVIGLCRVLGVGVRVVYVDRGEGAEHTFPDDSTPPLITMLYRPGHYDILYPAAVDAAPPATTS